MDAAEMAQVQDPTTFAPRLVVASDDRESPWVVDIASRRVVRRGHGTDPAAIEFDRRASS